MTGTVESMTSQCASKAGSAPVVGRPGCPQSSRPVARGEAARDNARASRCARAVGMLMLIIAMVLAGVTATPSRADEAAPSQTSTSTAPSGEDVSANIVDTQNLLGDNLGAVTDAIKETYERTGVTVRLIYVNSFNTDKQPDAWAAQTLKSLDPPPNTVLLAVASNDGNLAVVVSPDSAEWLRNRKTVDKLSEAASAPLTDGADVNGPNWAKSAIDMMKVIQTTKSTATSSTAASVGTIVMIGAVAVLLVGAVVLIVVRRRRETEHDAERVVEDEKAQDEDAREAAVSDAPASDADRADQNVPAATDER